MGTFTKGEIFGSQVLTYPLSLIRYMTHGIFEILAYFMAGLAGGIISVAIIKNHLVGEHKKRILKDSLDLILLAVAFLVIGAIVEVFITPLLF